MENKIAHQFHIFGVMVNGGQCFFPNDVTMVFHPNQWLTLYFLLSIMFSLQWK
jgi:hypothetical protein